MGYDKQTQTTPRSCCDSDRETTMTTINEDQQGKRLSCHHKMDGGTLKFRETLRRQQLGFSDNGRDFEIMENLD